MRLPALVGLVGAAVAGLVATSAFVHGKSAPDDEAEKPGKVAALGERKSATLRVYEWGVDRVNWDGSAVSPNDVPDFYYSADEVPISAEVEKPAPRPRVPTRSSDGASCAKPVVYFECDNDVVMDIEVKFLGGTIDWMYPKPSRRTDAATAQWDDVRVYTDAVKRAGLKIPALHDVAVNHWANYSREGAKSTLVAGAEAERFLFYEGTKDGLPEADVALDADGNVVVRNFGCCPIHDLRLRLRVGDSWRMWFVREIAAANGDAPTAVKLTDAHQVNIAAARKVGELAVEARAAGLTQTQAAVFERCWRDDFLMGDKAVMTYRHDQRWLDESVALKFSSGKNSLSVESARVCYVWLNGIDLSRQAELEKLADAVAGGDADAGAKLAKLGTGGIGAVRRLMSDTTQSLARRLKLAKWMKDQSQAR